ncbi:MAG: hypothetical protein Q8N23_13740 [Archangium sp.]|nr:hypothetical protein [Archangium sp.]MDP3153735.1 hypothetical protein [Archangium sp.]MDP3569216.1 hypothetical protein [Archangium sp.]
MKISALLLAAVVALGAAPVRAEDVVQPAPKQRGFMTGLGMGFLIGGMASIGMGVGGLLGANDAEYHLSRYDSPTALEQPGYDALKSRLETSTALAVTGFIGGALAIAGGITFIMLDGPTPAVAFVPTAQGGVLVFSGRF